MFSKKKSPEDDFVIVEFPYSLSPYSPSQLNKVLKGWLKDKKDEVKLETSFYVEKLKYCAGWILSKKINPKKVALFNVANYPSISSRINIEYPTLDEALKAYHQKKISCSKLVIPIAELKRKHFRLLVIEPEKNQAAFYDSKSRWVGMAAEVMSANSLEEYRYIEKVCEKHFPGIVFYAIYFGDQAWNNHEDCGPYTAEYAFHEVMPSFIHSMDQARANHEILYSKGVMSDAKLMPKEKTEKSKTLSVKTRLFCEEGVKSPRLVELEDDWVEVPTPK
jgi:hypothetical protein